MSKKKINKNKVGIAIMLIFTIIGIAFIIIGLNEYKEIKNEYSKENIEEKLRNLKEELNNQNKKIESLKESKINERQNIIIKLQSESDENKINELNTQITNLNNDIDSLNSYIQNGYCLSLNDEIFIACSIKSDISKLENIDSDYEISKRLDKYIMYTMIGSFTIIVGVVISSGLSLKSKNKKKKVNNDLKMLKEITDLPEDMIKMIEEKATRKKGNKNVKK